MAFYTVITKYIDPKTGDLTDDPNGTPCSYAVNKNGQYIGGVEIAKYLCDKLGIDPEPLPAEFSCCGEPSGTCSIGYSEKDNKWYGWSHRAIYGFTIGDVVKKGDCIAMSGYTEECREKFPHTELPVGFEAKTLDDARRMAIAFAGCVS